MSERSVNKTRVLIRAGADVNAITNGETALMAAAAKGRFEIVELLINAGADVNAKGAGGITALMRAATEGQVEIVATLLDAGADVLEVGVDGATAQTLAERNGHTEVAELLREALQQELDDALFEAASSGEARNVRDLLLAGADADAERDGVTALMAAAAAGHANVVSALVQAGAGVEATGEAGMTALMKAAEDCQTKVVRILLRAGADAQAKDVHGCTALSLAERIGCAETAAAIRAAVGVKPEEAKEQPANFLICPGSLMVGEPLRLSNDNFERVVAYFKSPATSDDLRNFYVAGLTKERGWKFMSDDVLLEREKPVGHKFVFGKDQFTIIIKWFAPEIGLEWNYSVCIEQGLDKSGFSRDAKIALLQ